MAAAVTAGDNSAGSWTKVTATAEMDLTSSDTETAIRYTITVDVKGRLASLGSTLVEPMVKSDIEGYFGRIGERAQAQ
jgi:carbon monoxide dehydrogenase subunit G